jgi:AraC family transcriptional regulator
MTKPKLAGKCGNVPANNREKTITSSRITVSDIDGMHTPLFSTAAPGLTSEGCAWAGISVEEHRLPPGELPERTADAHLIALHFRPAKLEWLLGGHAQSRFMRRGNLDIVPHGTIFGQCSCDETEFLIVALDPWLVEQVAKENAKANHVELLLHLGINDRQIEHIVLALKAELQAGCPSGRLYGDALAVALAAQLLGKYAARLPIPNSYSACLPTRRLARVIQYVNDNLSKDLTLSDLAAVARMNPHHFSRAFKQSTGYPPHRYVNNCRVDRAKRLLTEDRLPLAEVGLSVGFQNQSHFTTLFHRLTGVTPKTYRKGSEPKCGYARHDMH